MTEKLLREVAGGLCVNTEMIDLEAMVDSLAIENKLLLAEDDPRRKWLAQLRDTSGELEVQARRFISLIDQLYGCDSIREYRARNLPPKDDSGRRG